MSPIWFLANLFLGCALATIPTMKCNLKSPNLRECVEKEIVPFLTTIITDGVPERGIKPYDPLDFPTVVTGIGKGAIRLDFEVLNGVFSGLSSTQFKSLKIAEIKGTQYVKFVVMTHHPQLVIQGLYKEKVLTARDEGNFTINITNVDVVTTVESKFEQRGDKNYLIVTNVNITLTIRGMNIDFYSKNKPAFAKSTVPLVNKIWPVLYKEAMERLKPDIEEIMKNKANEATTNMPMEDIFSG